MNSRVSVLEGEYLDGNSIDPDLEAAFDDFRSSMNEGESAEGTMNAYKVPMDKDGNTIAKSAKQAFLFSCPIGTVSLIDIINRCKREFMRKGELVMTVRLTGHKPGKRGNEFNKVIRIEKENEPEEKPAAPGQTDVVELMRAMQESMSNQRAEQMMFMKEMMAMRTLAQPSAASAGDPLAMMEKLMMMQTVMNKFAPMLGNTPAAATSAALDPVQQLMGTMRLMKEFKSIMGEGGGDSDGDGDSWISAIKGLGGPFLQLMAENERTKRVLISRQKPRQLPGKTGARETPAAAPGAAGASTAAASSTSQSQGDTAMLAQFREQLKSLCDMAAEGTAADAAAQMVLDMIPEEGDFDERLGDLVADENKERFMPTISTIYSGCAKHAVWFEELRVNIAAGYGDPDAVEDDA